MANDGGLIATLEQWFADQLAALTSSGELVFKKADVWKHQVAATSGGLEAFDEYSPFAFVSYQSDDSVREGGNDLRQILEFAIIIGVTHKHSGVARTGSSNKLGTSKIRDLVIALFDHQHPGDGFACDDIYYTGSIEAIDSPKRHAIEMRFETSKITPPA